jgi:hypothetical protein
MPIPQSSVLVQTLSSYCIEGSVVHESGTPYCELGYLGFFADLGRTGFTGLTPVIARVHIILLESMQFNVKSQNQETLSYI